MKSNTKSIYCPNCGKLFPDLKKICYNCQSNKQNEKPENSRILNIKETTKQATELNFNHRDDRRADNQKNSNLIEKRQIRDQPEKNKNWKYKVLTIALGGLMLFFIFSPNAKNLLSNLSLLQEEILKTLVDKFDLNSSDSIKETDNQQSKTIESAISSSDKLTREFAKQQIIKFNNYPHRQSITLIKIYVKGFTNPGMQACLIFGASYAEYKGMLDKLEQAGVITVTENGPLGDCAVVQAVVSLTEEGKQYFVREYKSKDQYTGRESDAFELLSYNLDFGEVTGIVEEKMINAAYAIYTLKKSNISPFGRIINNVSEETMEKSQTFIKFDDGWRIR